MKRIASVYACFLALAVPLRAQETTDVVIEVIPVADGVHMLLGQGGNIGLSTGEDGVFLVDDQFAPLTEKILEAVRTVDEGPVRFVVNTHWHGDHTGGNENLGKAGAVIVAHANVRARMSVDQFMEAFSRTVPASPRAALPVITFTDALTFHWNGDKIESFHVAHAHTDGDAIIHFTKANAFHMGDIYFNGMYPFIDVGSGGSVHGMLRAVEYVLERANADTRIIPGHGPLSNRDELVAYHQMLAAVASTVALLIEDGKSRDEVIAAAPTAPFDAEWGGGFMQPDRFTGILYDSLSAE